MTIVVIGSGLAAVGVIRRVIATGVKPIVLDIGTELPQQLIRFRNNLSRRSPSQWTHTEREIVGKNDGLPGRVVPRKLVLGSDYFYSDEQMLLTKTDVVSPGSPPWSPARGGFSVGWGAAVLPPAPTDLLDWPFSHDELLRHMNRVLVDIPISEPRDEISAIFGTIVPSRADVLPLSEGQRTLLDRLQTSKASGQHDRLAVGQSRLLTDPDAASENGCRMCGFCSSGCIYGSIYTAEHDINRWIAMNSIDYRPGATVFKMQETADGVRVYFTSAEGVQCIEAEKVFLGAGAVNTTRILLNSSPTHLRNATIRSTGGILQLFGSLSRLQLTWPTVNTQTAIFIEMFVEELSPHWAHVQVGQPNELLLRRLGMSGGSDHSMKSRVSRAVAEHLITAMLNLHSDHGPRYDISVSPSANRLGEVSTIYNWNQDGQETARQLLKKLTKSLRTSGFVRIPGAGQYSAPLQGFHMGSSFPMSENPRSDYDTDPVGRPFGWQHVYVCDTTALPAIPATTIGLLTMANAHRIASAAFQGSGAV